MLSSYTTTTSGNGGTSSSDVFLIGSVEEKNPKNFGKISYKSDDNIINSSDTAQGNLEKYFLEKEFPGKELTDEDSSGEDTPFWNDLHDKMLSASGNDTTILEEKEYEDRSDDEILWGMKNKEELLETKEQIIVLQKELMNAASQHGDDVTELSQEVDDLYWKLSDANDKIFDLRKELDAKKSIADLVGPDIITSSYSSTEGQEKKKEAIKNEVRELKTKLKDKDNVHEKELAELRGRLSDSGEREEVITMKDGLKKAIQRITLLQKQFEDKQLSKESNVNSPPQELEKLKKMWVLKESEYKSKQVELEEALLAAKAPHEDNTMTTAARKSFQAELKKRDEMLETARMKLQGLTSEEEQHKSQDNTYCELVVAKEQIGALEKELQDIKSQQREETSDLQRHQEREIEALHRQLHDVHISFAQKETQYQNELDELMHYHPSYGTENLQLEIPSMNDNKKQQQSATIATAAAQPLSEQDISVNSNQQTLGSPSKSELSLDQSGDRWSSFGSNPLQKHQSKSQGLETNSSISSSSLKDGDQQKRTEPSERQTNNGGDLYSNDNSMYQQQQDKGSQQSSFVSSSSSDRFFQYDLAPFDERNAPPPPPPQYFPNQQESYTPLNSNQKSNVINGPESRWSRWSSFGNIPFRYDQSKNNSQQEAHYTQEYNNNISFQEGTNLGNCPETCWSNFGDSSSHYDEPSLQQVNNNDVLQYPETPFQYTDSPPENFPENLPLSPMDPNASPDNHWSASGNSGGGMDPR